MNGATKIKHECKLGKQCPPVKFRITLKPEHGSPYFIFLCSSHYHDLMNIEHRDCIRLVN